MMCCFFVFVICYEVGMEKVRQAGFLWRRMEKVFIKLTQ